MLCYDSLITKRQQIFLHKNTLILIVSVLMFGRVIVIANIYKTVLGKRWYIANKFMVSLLTAQLTHCQTLFTFQLPQVSLIPKIAYKVHKKYVFLIVLMFENKVSISHGNNVS